MKDMKELEDMTYWEITTNEGVLTNLVLGLTMITISIMYAFIDIYYKIKWSVRRN